MHHFEYKDHQLCCEGLPIQQIAAKVGTPFYLYSYSTLVRHFGVFDQAFKGIPHLVCYSAKANSNTAILRLFVELGAGIDVVSRGGLYRARNMGKKAAISIRVNPDIDPKTHPYISTGLKKNKFGIDINEAITAYRMASQLPNLEIVGIDCHIGSQLTQLGPFVEALKKLKRLIEQLRNEGRGVGFLDLGG